MNRQKMMQLEANQKAISDRFDKIIEYAMMIEQYGVILADAPRDHEYTASTQEAFWSTRKALKKAEREMGALVREIQRDLNPERSQ